MIEPSTTDTEAAYRLWAATYDAQPNPMIAMAQTAISSTLPTVRGRSVVELGCGTGTNLGRLLPEEPRRLHGVDFSAEMLAVARKRLPESVSLEQHDLREPLELEPASADIILVSLVLEHLESVAGVLASAAPALRPGGSMHIFEIHPDLVRAGTGAHFEHEGQRYQLPSFPHDEEEFRSAATAAGLRARSVRSWTPDAATAAVEPKVMKHQGQPMLLSVHLDKS